MKLLALLILLTTAVSSAAPYKEDTVIFRDPAKYSAFPSLTHGEGDKLWVSFGWNTTRSHYGKAAGGETGGELFFSPDGGKTWIHKDDEGFELRPSDPAASNHDLGDGILARAYGRGHEILTKEQAEELKAKGINVVDHKNGNWTACYRAQARRSTDGGKTWKHWYPDLPPVKSLMGSHDPMGAMCEDGAIVCPVYGRLPGDEVGRVFGLRSTDRGETWSLTTIAFDGIHSLNETSLIHMGGPRILAHIRCEPSRGTAPPWERGFVFQATSADCGATWSDPVRLPIWGYPQTLIKLSDGAILSTYGYRRPPYGIRACFSYDNGKTWDWENEVVLRSDALPGGPAACHAGAGDLGYPRSTELSDGTLFTVYYFTLADGVTHIACTRWSRDFKGPADLARGEAAIPKPDPSLPPEHIVGEVAPLKLIYGLMQSFIPTEPKVGMVAVRVSEKSEGYPHTHGLYVAIRKPSETTWWTEFLGNSEPILPQDVNIGGWNAFRFKQPVEVTPGDTYVLTVYNRDYIGGGETRLKDGLEGDHWWYVNSAPAGPKGYPNGGISTGSETDLAFKVYAEEGPLPQDP